MAAIDRRNLLVASALGGACALLPALVAAQQAEWPTQPVHVYVGFPAGSSPDVLARHPLVRAGLDGHRGIVAVDLRLNRDVVGLGASAPAWYPAVGDRLGCRMILPEHAGVANAIGAVVGRVTVRRSGTVTSPAEGRYRAHLPEGPEDFASPDEAMARLESQLQAEAGVAAAGAEAVQFTTDRDIRTARTEAREVFVEAMITVEASGRPRMAG